MQRGEIWLIAGARERLGLVISSDVYNGTDVPVLLVAEVVEADRLRDSPLAVTCGEYVVMPDRLSSPMKKWFVRRVEVADIGTMRQVSRALRSCRTCEPSAFPPSPMAGCLAGGRGYSVGGGPTGGRRSIQPCAPR